MRLTLSLLLLGLLAACTGEGGAASEAASPTEGMSGLGGALSPDDALKSFRLDSLFHIEVFAAEPYVRDPVDLVFDAYGRAYAAEMLDYPDEDGPPAGRIRLLRDTDGDGRIDDAVVFADSLRLISGLQPWNGGLIVTSAPDILYLRDVNGDGVADRRTTLFTGFAEANAQHRVASPRFALDNWIYVANDGAPGFIRPPGGDSVSVLGADFRFRPPAGGGELRYEPASGPAQFGQAFDAFGQRFITHNTIHVRHVVIPRRYFERNPYLTSASSTLDVSDHGLRVYQTSDAQPWRVSRTEAREQRYRTEGLRRTEHRADVFTAVAGAAIVGDASFPPSYRGNLFTGETAANLVHRDALIPSGSSFAASRARGEDESEFLTSTDPWFRPCNVVVGPDGYLYVVDMYREIIESPEYIPEAIRRDLDFRRGTEYGRIYRIVPRDRKVGSLTPPGEASSRELVDMLVDPNPWRRLTAHRLLLERGERSAADELERVVRHNSTPYARLHALYLLDGLDAVTKGIVSLALVDPHPGVREHGLRFGESFPGLEPRVSALADDPSGRVRLQAALTLGSFASEAADSALTEIALLSDDDPWIAAAVLTSPPERAMRLLERLLHHHHFSHQMTDRKAELVEDLSSVVGARGVHGDVERLVDLVHRSSELELWREAVFSGLATGFALGGARHVDIPAIREPLERLLDETTGSMREAVLRAAQHFLMPDRAEAAIRIAGNGSVSAARRIDAAEELVMGPLDLVEPALEALLDSGDAAVQAAAVQALARFTEDRAAQMLLRRWEAFGAPLREEVARVLSSRRPWLTGLLAAAESGSIETDAFDMDVRLRLLDHPHESVRRRAAAVMNTAPPQDVVSAFRQALEQDGDGERGRGVFYRECARCHVSGVGPDLVGVSNKSRELLLEAIVAPSRAIPATYAAYVADLSDGSIVSGRIVREMPGALTFRSAAEVKTVLRDDIRTLRAASRSIMPDDYGRRLDDRELADLIAFLQAGTGR